MRWIRLVGKSIIELAKNYKLSLIVVVIGLVLSETGFYFFNGFSQGLFIKSINNNPKFRTYSVANITNTEYFQIIESLSNSKGYDVEDIKISTAEIQIDEKKAKVVSNSLDKISGLYGGGIQSMSFDSNSSELTCIIPRALTNSDKGKGNVGSYINIAGKQFKIIGIIESYLDDIEFSTASGEIIPVYVPIEQFKLLNIDIKNIKINANHILEDDQFNKLANYISKINSKAKLEKIEAYEKETSNTADAYFQQTLMYLLICAISIINSLLLLKFWFEKNKKENLCYRICGATNLKLFLIMFIELITLVMTSEIISIILFEFLFRKIFTSYGVLIVLGVREYMFSSGLIFLVASASIIIMIYKELKNNYGWRASE